MGVPGTVLAANVRWLSRYRHPRCAGRPGSGLDAGLLRTFAMGTALLAGAEATGDRLQVLEVEATVVRIKGKGLLRKATKTTAGRRILRLPKWSVEMLRERSRAVSATPDTPVFPTLTGKLRDPSNTAADRTGA